MNDDRHADDYSASWLNPLPNGVWLLLLAIALPEAIILAGTHGFIGGPSAIGWRLNAVERLGFAAPIQHWMIETHRAPPGHLWRYLTYSFIHISPLHAGFVMIFVAALGKYVGEQFRTWALLVVALTAAICGAVVFGLVAGDEGWLLGGYPIVFGLVGAFTWLRWRAAAGEVSARWRSLMLIGTLMLARVAFGLLSDTGLNWTADLAAFGTGVFMSILVGPGGWHQLLQRIRAR
jgi:rhomboid protease GluP